MPIEIGKHYADENWSQKLMTLQEFIKKYYLSDCEDLGYLAQHNLFEQVGTNTGCHSLGYKTGADSLGENKAIYVSSILLP